MDSLAALGTSASFSCIASIHSNGLTTLASEFNHGIILAIKRHLMTQQPLISTVQLRINWMCQRSLKHKQQPTLSLSRQPPKG